MVNKYLIDHFQRKKLEKFGFVIESDLASEAISNIVSKLKPEIEDISNVYNLNQLLMMYDAMNGDDIIIPLDKREKRFDKEIIVQPSVIKNDGNRKKVRIDLTADSSYAIPIFEYMSRYEQFQLVEIKTGLAIKYNQNGFLSNVINYNELRTINGVLFGNLYFNMVRDEDQFESLKIEQNHKWFRGFACVPKINIYDVIDHLDRNIDYLVQLSTLSQKRRLKNASRLLQKNNR